jgi:hypothetical protein
VFLLLLLLLDVVSSLSFPLYFYIFIFSCVCSRDRAETGREVEREITPFALNEMSCACNRISSPRGYMGGNLFQNFFLQNPGVCNSFIFFLEVVMSIVDSLFLYKLG